MEVDSGILCCVIGIITSVGSIISNLTRDNYQAKVKIGKTEVTIEKQDLVKLHSSSERFQKEIEELKESNKELRGLVEELKKNGIHKPIK